MLSYIMYTEGQFYFALFDLKSFQFFLLLNYLVVTFRNVLNVNGVRENSRLWYDLGEKTVVEQQFMYTHGSYYVKAIFFYQKLQNLSLFILECNAYLSILCFQFSLFFILISLRQGYVYNPSCLGTCHLSQTRF